MTMNCYKCHHPNLHGSNFCEKCGNDLKSPPPARPVSGFYQGRSGPPSGERNTQYAAPAPAPTPAPRPAPAGAGHRPPAAAVPPPPPMPPRAETPPRAPVVPQSPPQRRREPVLTPGPAPQNIQVTGPSAKRDPLPFARLSGKDGSEFPLRYDVSLIGRQTDGVSPQVDLSAADTSGTVSRQHARIGKDDSSIFLEDLGSSNGTRHNGRPLQPGMQAPLKDGDQILFGALLFTFRLIGK